MSVAVVGNLCWDVIVRGLRALPRWGEEAEGDGNLQAPGGQGYNLAVALTALGLPAALVGAVGNDQAGDAVLAAAREHGVDTGAVTVDPRLPTALTAALVRTDGERAFASDFGCQRAWGADQILSGERPFAGTQIVAVAGLFNIPGLPVDGAIRVLRAAHDAGAATVLDTGWDPLDWPAERRAQIRAMLAEVDFFLPNEAEARAITGLDDPLEAAWSLYGDGASEVVVKRGAAGCVAVGDDGAAELPALPVTVRDAVGAGDTFDAGYLVGVLGGLELETRLALAVAAAGARISGDADLWPSRDAADEGVRRLQELRAR